MGDCFFPQGLMCESCCVICGSQCSSFQSCSICFSRVTVSCWTLKVGMSSPFFQRGSQDFLHRSSHGRFLCLGAVKNRLGDQRAYHHNLWPVRPGVGEQMKRLLRSTTIKQDVARVHNTGAWEVAWRCRWKTRKHSGNLFN